MAVADLYQDPNQKKKDPNAPPGDLAQAPSPAGMNNSVTGDPRPGTTGGPQPATAPIAPPSYDPRPGTQTGPAPAAPQTPAAPLAAPAAPAAPAAATPALAPGWTQAANGMVTNTATGQMVPMNHPIYQQALAASAPAAAPTDPTHGGDGPQPPVPIAPPDTTAPPGTAPPTTTPAAPPTEQQNYLTALTQQLQQAGTPASLSDPALKAQSDAYAVGQSRATDQARSAMAERAAAEGSTGTSSGAFDQGLVGLIGQQGENMAGENASLVGQANTQKLAQMQNALQMMGSDVNSEAGRQLQQHIADMQAQIQRDQLTQQNTQFGKSQAQQLQESQAANELQKLGITTQGALGQGDLALRGRLGDQQGNLSLLGLLMNNDQFRQQLGQQGAQFGAGLDQSGLLGLLGMLG
jgi:hypothetical protein